jgi:hypothetical protein
MCGRNNKGRASVSKYNLVVIGTDPSVPEGCDGDGLGRYSFGKAQTSKKLQLNVDPISRWMAANNACDNLKMVGDFDRQGMRMVLVITIHPFAPS